MLILAEQNIHNLSHPLLPLYYIIPCRRFLFSRLIRGVFLAYPCKITYSLGGWLISHSYLNLYTERNNLHLHFFFPLRGIFQIECKRIRAGLMKNASQGEKGHYRGTMSLDESSKLFPQVGSKVILAKFQGHRYR